MPVTRPLRKPALHSGPGLATLLTVAAMVGALIATALIGLVPGLADDGFPVTAPYGTDPIDEVDGIPLADLPPHTVVRIDAAALPADAAADVAGFLATQPDVIRVEPAVADYFLLVGPDLEQAAAIDGVADSFEEQFAQLTDLPTHTHLQWHLRNTGQLIKESSGTPNVDISWTYARERATGDGVTVAVIDSAFDFQHPDLAGARWVNEGESCSNGIDDTNSGKIDDCQGWNFVRDSNDVGTFPEGAGGPDMHGTHVAATIAASLSSGETAGVAPDATIMPLQITEGSPFTLSRVAAAMTYAVDQGADVINLSLATDPGSGESEVIRTALEHAEANDVFVVAAAGNSGDNIDEAGKRVLPASYAKDFGNLVAVAATDFNDDLSAFSNRGEETITLAAPGEMILSATPGDNYRYMSGTSMAAPVVSATAALVIEHQGTPADQLEAALVTAAVDADVTGVADGKRLNAAAALGIPIIGYGDIEVEASGLADLETLDADGRHRVESELTVRAPVGVTPRFTLGLWLDDGAYALVEHQVTLGSGATTTTADTSLVGIVDGPAPTVADDGSGSPEPLVYDLTTNLPEGRYVLLVDDAAQAPIAPTAVFFTVGDLPKIPDPDAGPGETGENGDEQGNGDETNGNGDETSGNGDDSNGNGNGDETNGNGDETNGNGDDTNGNDDDSNGSGDETNGSGDETNGNGDETNGNGDDSNGNGDDTNGNGDDSNGNGDDSNGNGNGNGNGDDTNGNGDDDPEESAVTWRVRPSSGPTTGKQLVTIDGSFDTEGPGIPTDVGFGGKRVTVSSASPFAVTVETPVRSDPGLVDVFIYAGEDLLKALDDSYTYVDESGDDGSNGGGDGDGGNGDGGNGNGGDGGNGDGGGDGGGGDGSGSGGTNPDPPSGGGVDGGGLPGDSGDGGEPDGLTWPPSVLSNGLTAAKFTSQHPLGGITLPHWSSSCTTDPCSSRSL